MHPNLGVFLLKNIFLFAPLRGEANVSHSSKPVLALKVQAAQPWEAYKNYGYVWGIGPKLNSIEQHTWTRLCFSEPLQRAPRLTHFCDTTGCRPLNPHINIRTLHSHHSIQTVAHCDHTTYWLGPNDEPLILTEPYIPSFSDIKSEIQQRQLSAIVLPTPGIYAGGDNWTSSVLMGLPEHQSLLNQITLSLNVTRWPKTNGIVELSWDAALKLSKDQAQEVRHG